MADILPINIPITSSEVLQQIDFLDTITGIAYKKFYLLGITKAAGANDYLLTTDSSIPSDEENYRITGNGTDTDFDIKVGKGFTVAAEDAILVLSRNSDTGSAQTLTYTIYHVNSGATETSIGTAVGDTINGGAGEEYKLKTQPITLTEKRFIKGDTLRLNITSSSGATDYYYFDPSGIQTQTAETPNYPHTSYILIPIVYNF